MRNPLSRLLGFLRWVASKDALARDDLEAEAAGTSAEPGAFLSGPRHGIFAGESLPEDEPAAVFETKSSAVITVGGLFAREHLAEDPVATALGQDLEATPPQAPAGPGFPRLFAREQLAEDPVEDPVATAPGQGLEATPPQAPAGPGFPRLFAREQLAEDPVEDPVATAPGQGLEATPPQAPAGPGFPRLFAREQLAEDPVEDPVATAPGQGLEATPPQAPAGPGFPRLFAREQLAEDPVATLAGEESPESPRREARPQRGFHWRWLFAREDLEPLDAGNGEAGGSSAR